MSAPGKAKGPRVRKMGHHTEKQFREEAPDEEESRRGAGEAGAEAVSERKVKGPALEDVDNPNRATAPAGPGNRREAEEMEKQRKREEYMKATLAGKTEEAKRDLDRLAAVRKEREEAAARRAAEKAEKENAKAASVAASGRKVAKK